MNKLLQKTISFIIALGIIIPTTFNFAKAQTEYFSDELTDYNKLDVGFTTARIFDGRIMITGNSVSAIVVSGNSFRSSYGITKAMIEPEHTVPADTQITYFLSNDIGTNWIEVVPNVWFDFQTVGKDLKWMAILSKENTNLISPNIERITISIKQGSSEINDYNDSTRISDLSAVSFALEKYYETKGKYPSVKGKTASQRWEGLKELLYGKLDLNNSYYIYNWPQDPLFEDEINSQSYDYKNISKTQYILGATLQNQDSSYLGQDLDGKMKKAFSCNDPVYCIGNVRSNEKKASSSTQQANITEILLASSKKISYSSNQSTTYSNQTVSNNDLQSLVNRALSGIYGNNAYAISSSSSNSTSSQSASIGGIFSNLFSKKTKNQTIDTNYGARKSILVRAENNQEVYEIINGQKHWILNSEIFNDYGFSLDDINIVSQKELDQIPRTKLFRVINDDKLYYLTEANRMKLIPSIEVFNSYENKVQDVVDISQTEFNSYPTIKYINLESKKDPRVWLISGNTKYPLSNEAIVRSNICQLDVAPVNKTEFDYYKIGNEIK